MDPFPLARPLLHSLAPERAHRLTVRALRHGLVPRPRVPADPALAQSLWGLDFPNPLGVAAGFDKDAEAVGPLLDLGFGFVEAGSVTPRPQPGNPKPRVFRLPADAAVINRLGFNSRGIDVALGNLRAFRRRGRVRGVVGVNLGKNKDTADSAADYACGVTRLGPWADYLVVNVSSPNTPGLRALQSRAELTDLLARVRTARAGLAGGHRPPILLKIAPDLTEADMEAIAETANAGELDGLVISNTTITRPPDLRGRHAAETGGLSGRPLFPLATERLSRMYRLTGGQVPIIGVGGVENAETALAKIRAGASLVQLYTSFVYNGPNVIADILFGIYQHIRFENISHISDLVGVDA